MYWIEGNIVKKATISGGNIQTLYTDSQILTSLTVGGQYIYAADYG